MKASARFNLLLFLSLVLFSAAFGQTAKVENFELDSKLMARKMPYRVVFPPDYEKNKEKRYPAIYLLHGLTGHFDNWTDKTKLAEYAARYNFIIITPEGGDGWYSDSVSVPNDKYESYIVQELIPEIDKKFRTISDRKNRIIGGLSMGGYGAIKFGLKYPEMFSLVGSFSGALGAAGWTEKELSTRNFVAESILSVFGRSENQTRAANDIFKIVHEMPPEKKNNLPFIYLDCGTEDFLILNNRDFASLLFEQKIKHEFRQLPGTHTWDYWDRQVREFLLLSEKKLK